MNKEFNDSISNKLIDIAKSMNEFEPHQTSSRKNSQKRDRISKSIAADEPLFETKVISQKDQNSVLRVTNISQMIPLVTEEEINQEDGEYLTTRNSFSKMTKDKRISLQNDGSNFQVS